jgi:hypothetical protein
MLPAERAGGEIPPRGIGWVVFSLDGKGGHVGGVVGRGLEPTLAGVCHGVSCAGGGNLPLLRFANRRYTSARPVKLGNLPG